MKKIKQAMRRKLPKTHKQAEKIFDYNRKTIIVTGGTKEKPVTMVDVISKHKKQIADGNNET